MIKKYIINSQKLGTSIMFGFNTETSVLSSFEITDAELNAEQTANILSVSLTLQQFLQYCKTIKQTPIEVKEDLSFANFWHTYNYKVGSKETAEKYHNALDETNKALVLHSIKPYKEFCQRKNIGVAYPERYIKKGYYKNVYKSVV
jgi:hypothetical protein